MSTDDVPPSDGVAQMSEYEQRMWGTLNDHWERHSNRRGLPNWANAALSRTGEVAGKAVSRVVDAVPEAVVEPIRRAGDVVADATLRRALEGLISLLEMANEAAIELNDPKHVEELARKRGVELDSFAELRQHDLKVCDRLLTRNTFKWRTFGTVEGGVTGALAMIPVAGPLASMTADILVVQVLSTSIAARIAYSYGYDAKHPDEQAFIQRLVRRSFMEQATKVEPMRRTAQAASAVKGRVRWSDKLRRDHRLLAELEKLMQHLGPTGAKVPVKNVAKVVPFVGILIGASSNAVVLGRVAADAQRYCQTRFLCEKYSLPLPIALSAGQDDLQADPV